MDCGTEPYEDHGNGLRDYSALKQDECAAFLQRICTELAEDLPTGFRLELSQRVYYNLFFDSKLPDGTL